MRLSTIVNHKSEFGKFPCGGARFVRAGLRAQAGDKINFTHPSFPTCLLRLISFTASGPLSHFLSPTSPTLDYHDVEVCTEYSVSTTFFRSQQLVSLALCGFTPDGGAVQVDSPSHLD